MINEFKYTEKDAEVFQREFSSRLPNTIIDNHIHVWTRCMYVDGLDTAGQAKYKPWTDIDYMDGFTVDDYRRYAREAIPGKRVCGMFFGLPMWDVDVALSNRYVIDEAKRSPTPFFYIPIPGEDAFAAQERLNLLGVEGFMGFKPFPCIDTARDCSNYEALNASFLEFANEHELSVVFHIQRKNRLRDPDNRREIIEMARNYPRVKFLLAHAGRSFVYSDIEGQIECFLPYENIGFDIAMLNSGLVLEYLFKKAPSERIVFGSDAPLAFYRGVDVCVNNTHQYLTPRLSQWGMGPLNADIANFTFYLYESFRAILYASSTVYGPSGEEKHLERIFHQNARALMAARMKPEAIKTLLD